MTSQGNGAIPADDTIALDALLRRIGASGLSFKARLADRISAVSAAFAEDYDGRGLSVASVDALLAYLETSPAFTYPDLTATPAGDIYAEWRGADARILTIEFLASGEARYLILRPNPRHPQRVDRLTGTTTADALPEIIAPLAHLTGLAA